MSKLEQQRDKLRKLYKALNIKDITNHIDCWFNNVDESFKEVYTPKELRTWAHVISGELSSINIKLNNIKLKQLKGIICN